MSANYINVFGLGYIGLPTAAVLAQSGFQVHGVDIDDNKIGQLLTGDVPIDEPQLTETVNEAINQGQLTVSSQPRRAGTHVIAVPTPRIAAHTPDLSYIYQAITALAQIVEAGDIVVLESTSPVGATEKLAQWLQSMRQDLKLTDTTPDIHIAYCPERVLPGQIMQELRYNQRIIGGLTPQCGQKAQDFYQQFVTGTCHLTSARTAEMAKLTENAFRDINIGFANELSMICDRLDVNVWELIDLVNQHPRVNMLKPGPGVGGHCIAIDPWFIVNSAPEESRLVRTAREVNDHKPQFIMHQVHKRAQQLANPVIACIGLSFKADVADLRESPALNITEQLSHDFSCVHVVEPHINELPPELAYQQSVRLVNLRQAVEYSNLLVILVDHQVFAVLKQWDLSDKLIVDTRGFCYQQPSGAEHYMDNTPLSKQKTNCNAKTNS